MITILKAYQFRLKTNSQLEQQFSQFAGCSRFIWNRFQRLNQDRLDRKEPILWYNEMAFWLTILKSSNECSFLKDCHSQVLQQTLKSLDRAYRDGFNKNQPLKRIPKPHKKALHNSFRFPQGFKLQPKRIYLPKIGWVNFFQSQAVIGQPKNVTISKKNQHWFVSIQVEITHELPVHPAKASVGIDLGIAKFAALSDGSDIASIHVFRKKADQLRIQQQALARKKKFSSNWKKQQLTIGKLHTQIANRRRDFLHKASTRLCKNHALIVVEDLKITNMSKSAKGTMEKPGKNIKAKSGLNKSILDQGWGEFRRQLTYKQDWLGGMLLRVSPSHTSMRCHQCQSVDKNNRLSQAIFLCQQCGHSDNADTNAAKNILAAGHAVLACGSNRATMRSEAGTIELSASYAQSDQHRSGITVL